MPFDSCIPIPDNVPFPIEARSFPSLLSKNYLRLSGTFLLAYFSNSTLELESVYKLNFAYNRVVLFILIDKQYFLVISPGLERSYKYSNLLCRDHCVPLCDMWSFTMVLYVRSTQTLATIVCFNVNNSLAMGDLLCTYLFMIDSVNIVMQLGIFACLYPHLALEYLLSMKLNDI